MPAGAGLLLGAELVGLRLAVELAVLDRANGADLRVVAAQLALRVEDGVDVQARRRRPARQLAQPEDERLLQLIGQVVLGAEEDDAALRDCGRSLSASHIDRYTYTHTLEGDTWREIRAC